MKYALAGFTLTETVRETQSANVLRGLRDADGVGVVVKLLRAEHPTGAQLARLRHEHALLSNLDLPVVVRTLGLVKHGRGDALVLEDLGDQSIESLFRNRRPSVAEFLDVAIGMTEAVAALHRRAIIHKDIKPHHFLVRDAALKIIDLGIATRLSSETQAATSANLLEGTLAYMSPEQTGRMNRSLDRRTDLYSLGVSFYQLLTGRLPFEASDPLELVHAHIARTPRPVHEVAPQVPKALSDIVAKLTAKAAEDRYQSAGGLKADLEACRTQLAGAQEIAAFALGGQDGSGELSIPQKLYGRAAELATLRASFDGAQGGGCRLLLISGYSGVGKSALVNELRKYLGKSGALVAGKFDQLNRSSPFAALAAASRGLIRSILSEPPEVLAHYGGRLREAVGRNGRLIAELAPEIELVIGPQAPVALMGPTEAQARFELVFRQFLQVFADEDHPLALFLDDLQWADAASLRLLRQLLTGGQCTHLLIVGAYRDNETSDLHPLLLMLGELRKAAVPIDEMILKPLDGEAVTALVAETLRLPAEKVTPLAETLLRKTNGNPFFLQQFLTTLAEQQLLRFDAAARQWTWDAARIEAAVAADNVVDLLIARLRRLPEIARRVLTLGACMGQEFDLATLSLIWQRPLADLTAGLWEALREGLVIPLDASYRYLAESLKTDTDLGEALRSQYRFLHDRVQEGAYELVAPDERAHIHLQIGRVLLGRPDSEPSDESLFEVVRQMNFGEALISGADERRRLARFNLRAGLRVAGSGAHGSALPLLRRCLDLLGADPWEAEHETTQRAHLSLAECEFMSGNLAGALQVLDIVEAQSRTVLERVAGREIRIVILASAPAGMVDAVTCGIETARLLGAEFPADDAGFGPAIGAELGALKALLAERTIESLLDLPTMADPEKRALVDVLFKTNAPAFMARPQVSVLIGLKAVRLAMEHGNAPMSPYFYDNYGIINNATGGELDVSFRFGQLGIDLLQKPGYAEIESSTHFLFGAFNSHWRLPIAVSEEHLRHSVKAGLDSGAYLHVAWAAMVGMLYRFYRGDSIPEILADIPQSMDLLRRAENPAAQTLLKVVAQSLKALSGSTASPTSLDGDGFDEAAFLETAKKIRILWVYYHVLKLQLVFHAGEFKRALELAEAAVPLVPGMFFITEHALYRSLARAALAAEETGEARAAAVALLRQEEESFRRWAEASPANHAHRHALVAAEIAGLSGETEQAMGLYDRAIKLARENGFVYHEAEANELCGKYHLRKQRTAVARAYLHEAYDGYQQWGAKTKLRQLVDSYPALLAGVDPTGTARAATSTTTTHSSTTDSSRGLDLVTAVRATQALAGELDLGSLLERLMRVIVENAGAQRGILVLNHDGQLEVEALVTVEESAVKLGLREPIERSARLAASIVQYVSRSKEALVLPDAAADPRFTRDPYVMRQRPRSLLCLAMQHQGRLVGVLYLENNAATNAFSVERVELLQFVAAQAAVAVENATLYGELRAATNQLREANDTLEVQVSERTEELRRTLAELWSEMDLARKIQMVLLPTGTRFRDHEVSAMMVPASTVGGDYYDIIHTDGSDWVLIGDVSGHGVTAGLSMMMIQTAIRTVVLGGGPEARTLTPAQVLSKVNHAVRGNLQKVDEDHYMTITGLQLEGRLVRYSGLHQDILVYRAAARAVERVETRGMWIGPVDDIAPLLRDDTFELAKGDIVLLFTDGITEAMVRGQRLGTDGLASVFGKLAADGCDNDGILRGIMQTMEGAPQDDVSLMAVRYLPHEAA